MLECIVWTWHLLRYLNTLPRLFPATSDRLPRGARGYDVIGQDTIPFHVVVWPAELMAYDPTHVLPHDIPANAFLSPLLPVTGERVRRVLGQDRPLFGPVARRAKSRGTVLARVR